MGTKSIPKDVKAKVVDIIDRFNHDVLADDYRTYTARFKGNYLFLYDECFFPGEDWVDGTIEGAMKAGLEAYQ
jgi:hypothetical protein